MDDPRFNTGLLDMSDAARFLGIPVSHSIARREAMPAVARCCMSCRQPRARRKFRSSL